MNTNVNNPTSTNKPFWENGHFFRDISLVIIFVQIIFEYQDVMAGLSSMGYASAVISMAVGNIVPFLLQMGWCLVLMLMFVFTLGGTSRWPLTIQMFITLGLILKYYLLQDYIWVGALSMALVIYYIAIKEVRRREIRLYLSDIIPTENETPLWMIILAFVILNIGFTMPAYERYMYYLEQAQAEYQKIIDTFEDVSETVSAMEQQAAEISNNIMNSEAMKMLQYYFKNMFTNGAPSPMVFPNQPMEYR